MKCRGEGKNVTVFLKFIVSKFQFNFNFLLIYFIFYLLKSARDFSETFNHIIIYIIPAPEMLLGDSLYFSLKIVETQIKISRFHHNCGILNISTAAQKEILQLKILIGVPT